ncbi:MAG: hypothetical protein JNM93_03000 [Bacteriovoracaceae bacterium]|nr:hypothetical protein [Bacteriovoracaceae bacterium]
MRTDKSEMNIVGVHAVLSAFKQRPNELIKIHLTKELLKTMKPVVDYCVKNKLAYHIVEAEKVEKISRSTHHEGVCALFVKPELYTLSEYLKKLPAKCLVVALQGVKNPHNLGAIMRIAAHFGVDALMVNESEQLFSSAAFRTAEGGGEGLKFIFEKDFMKSIELFKKNQFELYATSSHSGALSLYKTQFPNRVVIFMGEERYGLSPELLKKIPKSLVIPGTGLVESLNVASATSVILSEVYRQIQK